MLISSPSYSLNPSLQFIIQKLSFQSTRYGGIIQSYHTACTVHCTLYRATAKNSFKMIYHKSNFVLINLNHFQLFIGTISNRGGYRGAGGHSPPDRFRKGRRPPPSEFGIFCSYFQNSFSIACLRERIPSAKQKKYLS